MRIVLDMQGAQTASRFRGLGRYTLSFARAVCRNRGEHEVFLALNGLFPEPIDAIRDAFEGVLPQDNIRVWHAPAPVGRIHSANAPRWVVAEILREAFLASLRPDVIHVSSLFEGYADDAVMSVRRFDLHTPVSVTLHDLIPLLNAKEYMEPYPGYERFYRSRLEELRRASLLLGISESSLSEAAEHLGIGAEQTVNASEGVDELFRPETGEIDALLRRLGVDRSFVLYVGGADRRKNLPRLIEAFAQLPASVRSAHQLVLAGKFVEGDVFQLRKFVRAQGLRPDEVRFSDYVSDEELVGLYSHCALFVFPSWQEGFGLPVIEAMACGAPVLAGNRSSLPEVVGLDEALFDPFDVDAIRASMERALTDPRWRGRLIRHGRARAGCFSWDETARRAIAAWGRLRPPSESQWPSDQDVLQAVARHIRDFDEQQLVSLSACIAQNRLAGGYAKGPKQLLVDVSEIVRHDARTGIQRVVRGVLHHWLRQPPVGYRVEPVFATFREGYRYARNFIAGTLDHAGGDEFGHEPIEFAPGDLFFGLDFQPRVVAQHREMFRRMRREGVRVEFLVHDLLCVSMPECFGAQEAEEFPEWLSVVADSDGAICVSKSVALELHDWLGGLQASRRRHFRIGWSHNGADISASHASHGLPGDADGIFHALSRQPGFLMVGTIEPRKGHAQVLAAFESLWAQGLDIALVIVGKQGWLVEALAARLRGHPERGQRLFWLDALGDEYLERVYGAAKCLIAASRGEGFGLPLVEAARHGLPIIARDLPVFREVAGQCAYYFEGESPEVLAQTVVDWLALEGAGKHPRSGRMPWLSWEQSADNLLRLLLDNQGDGRFSGNVTRGAT
ncbi:glycosyltransferase family 4 protein [Pseudazoarcus pumilus]|nr:glycosyltransferase family 1 protein [Pseudazoarcus pumilus]